MSCEFGHKNPPTSPPPGPVQPPASPPDQRSELRQALYLLLDDACLDGAESACRCNAREVHRIARRALAGEPIYQEDE